MPKALCQSYNVNSANQPKLGAQMNSLTLQGALMVPKCLLMQEPTQRNISTYHISQSKKIIFRYSLYILGKKLSSLISKYITNATGHGKRTLARALSLVFVLSWIQKDCHGELEIISTIRRRKKEWIQGERMITVVGLCTLSGFIFKWKHLQIWPITAHSGGNPHTLCSPYFTLSLN